MEAIYGFDTGKLPVDPLEPDVGGDGRPVKVGFFGLQWSIAPQCVRAAVRRIKQRLGKRVQFEIIASREVPEDSRDLFEWQSTEEMNWTDSLRLLRSRGWDIGLAPLEDTEFNASKQATKFRDYAWAGMAMVCSRVPAYQRPIIDGIHGLLVDNTEVAWEDAIARLIEDHDLRERLRRTARDLFAQAHTLDATICSWYQLLWRIARHREGRGLPQSQRLHGRVVSAAQSRLVAPALSSSGISASRPLTGGRFHEIVPEGDGWEALDVMLGLHQRSAAGQLVLSIYADAAVDQPLRRIVGDLAEAADNCLFRFSFPPIANSRHRRMLLRFDIENPGADTLVSLYEQGRPPRSLLPRALGKLSHKGGPLFCRLGFRSWSGRNGLAPGAGWGAAMRESTDGCDGRGGIEREPLRGVLETLPEMAKSCADGTTFSCRSCEGHDWSPYLDGVSDRLRGFPGTFDYVRCSECGLVQIIQVPMNLSEFYAGYALHTQDSMLYALARKVLVGHCYLMPRTAGGKLLDIGCGNGWYLRSMQRRGWQPFGYEFSAPYAQELSGALGFPVFSGPEELRNLADAFDLVTFNFSFEHLVEPETLLRIATECLRPGGKLYLAVPNIEGREARLFGRRWFHLDPPRHIAFYSKRLLADRLVRLGLVDIEVLNLAVATGFSGSMSYLLAGRMHSLLWYLGTIPGLAFSLLIRDGNFSVMATKPSRGSTP
jgi:SAM-dependent methyltransferase